MCQGRIVFHKVAKKGLVMVKKCTAICLFAIGLVIASFGADNVFTETVNGLKWTYRVVDGEAVLGGNNDARAIPTSTFGAITIPDKLGGWVVTGIGSHAFHDCNAITLASIPESIKHIENDAFRECSGLITMVIPNSVTSIGGHAFFNASGLMKICMSDKITDISDSMFEGCHSLCNVTLPQGLKRIGDRAFQYCGSISQIDIPQGVTSIVTQAFYHCGGLSSVTIPTSVINIGPNAFNGSSLRDVRIPGSVKSLGDAVFAGVSSLTNVVMEVGLSGISSYMFRDCQNLKCVVVPSSVGSIGNYAFAGCKSLPTLVMPLELQTIGNFAFEGCKTIDDITIPVNVQIVGGYAFKDCTNLKSIKFLGNAPIVDEITFENVNADCTAYVSRSSTGWDVDIPGKWMGINIDYFDPAIYTVVLDANGGSLGEAAGEVAFGEGEVMCSLPVPERESYAFLGWYTDAEGGTRVAEGSVVTGNMTLYAHWQEAVPVLTIEDGVLVGVALNGGTRIEIPDGVKVIADEAFASCAGLESVSIPNSVTSMTFSAFSRCDKLWTKWYRALANGVMPNAVDLTVTNVVVHYVTQSMPSAAVVPPDTTGIVNVISEVNAGSAVAITADWAAQYPGFVAKFGSDFTKAITAETGKRDGAGRPMMVWQDFVAGTDPTNPDDVFKASITFDAVTGDPIVSWTPELSAAEAAKRTYKTFGKVRLNDPDWTLIDGDADNYNFFKVTVQMK